MSIEAMNAVRSHRVGSANRKALLYVLADYAAADWSTYVGQARLAAETELGERTVRRILAELEADGLIRRERRYQTTRGRTSDRIVLVHLAIARLPATMAARKRRPTEPILRPPATVLPAKSARSTGQALAGEPLEGNLTEPSGAQAREERRRIRTEAMLGAGGFAATLARRSEPSPLERRSDDSSTDRGGPSSARVPLHVVGADA